MREHAESAYHPCGTCRMGAADDPMAVVDPECRVIGVERLRVADSSIFPQVTNGNLNAPSIMTGEKAADQILGRALLPPRISSPGSTPIGGPASARRRSCESDVATPLAGRRDHVPSRELGSARNRGASGDERGREGRGRAAGGRVSAGAPTFRERASRRRSCSRTSPKATRSTRSSRISHARSRRPSCDDPRGRPPDHRGCSAVDVPRSGCIAPRDTSRARLSR